MNYNFLIDQIKKKGHSVSSLSKEIGMSQVGLKQSIDRKSLRIDKLEKISDKIGVPIYMFFEDLNNKSKPIITVEHKLDGYADYDKNLFIHCSELLTELVDKNKDLLQKDNVLAVSTDEIDTAFYEIVEIIIGNKSTNVYVIDYEDSFWHRRYLNRQ